MPRVLLPDDPLLTYFSPQPVERTLTGVRLERFPPAAYQALCGQIGPTANLRSSSGCAVLLRTDSPWLELRLERLRHHQLVPVGIDCEVEQEAGESRAFGSMDLRERSGAVAVPFATGLERGGSPRGVMLWLPLISTCAVSGVVVADGSAVEPAGAPDPRWLAIGDSLTQGFCVQSPTQHWVHRLARRWNLPAWNLGVAGVKIEPSAIEWALSARRWELVTIGLGGNHAWTDADAATAPERAVALVEIALAGGHGRVVWILPPWKPCEDGKGPPEFAGVPLDRVTGDRMKRVRESLRERVSRYAPRLEILGDLLPHDPRYFPDGLHPFAIGFSRMADPLDEALHGSPVISRARRLRVR